MDAKNKTLTVVLDANVLVSTLILKGKISSGSWASASYRRDECELQRCTLKDIPLKRLDTALVRYEMP